MNIMQRFLKNEAGVAALIFALSVPVIIGSAGIGVDVAKAYHTKNKLEKTLDAAALAGASTNYTGSELEDFITDYVEQNFRNTDESEIEISSIVVTEDPDENEIQVDAIAKSTNSFMPFFNKDYINVAATAVAKEKLTGVEVVLVLDDSSSMGELDEDGAKASDTGNSSRVDSLKKAAKDFIDVLYDSADANGGRVKIGIVPYGENVNVGPYGLGRTPSGNPYDGGYEFVENPNSRNYTTKRDETVQNPNFGWGGCVMEHDFYDTSNHTPTWPMSFHCHGDGEVRKTNGWDCRTGRWKNRETCVDTRGCNVPNTFAARGNCPRDVWVDGVLVGQEDRKCGCPSGQSFGSRTCTPNPTSAWNREDHFPVVNRYCPDRIVTPMVQNNVSGSRDELKDSIDALRGNSGSTQSDLGMAWGYHLISPDRPFTEGSDFGSSDWTKVIVFMTDGDIHTYEEVGPYYERDWGDRGKRIKRSKELFTNRCDQAKSQGILVYTVQFGTTLSTDNETLLKACASGPDKALEASSGSMLVDAFNTIAEDLGTIFLAR